MLLAGLSLPVSSFVDSWRVYKGKTTSVFGGTKTEVRLGLRGGNVEFCNKKRSCESGSFKYKYAMFTKSGGKMFFVVGQATFYGSMLASLLLLIGAGLLQTNHYHGHTFMNLSLAATLFVMIAGFLFVRDPGLREIAALQRGGLWGMGFSYILFTGSITLALFGIRNVWRGTLEQEEKEWFGDDGLDDSNGEA